MRPAQVLDMHMDLLQRIEGEHVFRKAVEYACTSAFEQSIMGQPVTAGALSKVQISDGGRYLANTMNNHLRAAYAFHVTPDMCDVVHGISEQLTDEDVFEYQNAPTGCGIVRFDKPLPMQDAHGKVMLAHWMIWGPADVQQGDVVRPRVATYWFNDPQSDIDEVFKEMYRDNPDEAQRMQGIYGRWNWCGVNLMKSGESMGKPLISLEEDHGFDLVQQVMKVARVNHDGYSLEGDEELHPITNTKRYVHALWITLNQTIALVEDADLDRAVKRRARKMNIPGRVTVISMRRTENHHHADGESMVEWQHRWIVRGHLAWRRCGPDLPGAEPYEGGYRRRIWIPAHWKGPEDAPIKITKKVYDLRR